MPLSFLRPASTSCITVITDLQVPQLNTADNAQFQNSTRTSLRNKKQADKQAGRQAGRQTDKQAGRQAGGQAGRQAGRHAVRHAGRQAGRQAVGRSVRPLRPVFKSSSTTTTLSRTTLQSPGSLSSQPS